MKLLEYKAQELFGLYDIPTNKGIVVDRLDDLKTMGEEISFPMVVKAQVLVGGRGKAGGIKFAENKEELENIVSQMLGSTLKGLPVKKVLVTRKITAEKEWYLSITLDRKIKAPLLIFSSQGGMDIEEVAKETPEKIVRVPIEPLEGIRDHMAWYILDKTGIDSSFLTPLFKLSENLYRFFREYDCLLAEINPLMVTANGQLLAVDAKVDIDDSSLFRHPDMVKFRDELTEDPLVLEARKYNFLYIPIDTEGRVGVISNGSGMLMSTIDLFSQKGVKTACALDLGGGATYDRIAKAIEIVFSNPQVEAVLINIFGGITRCDEVARGVELARQEATLDKFLVVRMEGTNREIGVEIVRNITPPVPLAESVQEGVGVVSEWLKERNR